MVGRMSSAVVVGRGAELARLRAALERAVAGSPATVVVAGEAGVGKTRLVLELAREAEARGAIVLVGGCLDVAGETLPYAPVAEALRSLPAAVGADELTSVLDGARAELARLVPELGEPVAGAPETSPGRFLELLLGVLHRLADGRAVALVVEDLQWADRSTRDLLAFLVRNLRGGVALLLTYRSDELHRRHPLRPFLAELERGGRAERIELPRLTRREVAELLEGISGREPNLGLAAAVWRRSEGNPFFAEELAAAHADGAELPEALRDLLLARVEALPEPTQRLLRVAAVAGRRVDHHLLAAVAGEPDERLVEMLREAVARHVLVVEEPWGYAFRHALVQEAIYDDVLPVERGPLHAGYGHALARRIKERGGHATAVELGQLAHHWYAAHDLGAALLASVRAGQAAEAGYAHAEAQRHYERALELWERAPAAAAESELGRTSLLERAAQAAFMAGEVDRAIDLGRLALAATDPAEEPLRAGTLLDQLSRYHWYVGHDLHDASTAVEQALAVIPTEPPSRELAMVLAGHARMLMLRGRSRDAVGTGERAITVARRVGAVEEEAGALATLGAALGDLGEVDAGLAHLERARVLAERAGAITVLARTWVNHASVLLGGGRAAEAVPVALAGLEALRRVGLVRSVGAMIIINAAEALILLGRWDEADRLLDQAADLDLPPVFTPALRLAGARVRVWRGEAAAVRAELAELARKIGTAVEPDPQVAGPLYAHLATVAALEGRLDEARAAVAEGLALLAGTDGPAYLLTLCLAGLTAEAARVERARPAAVTGTDGDPEVEQARRVAAELLRHARKLAGTAGVGRLPQVRAQLLAAEAEWSRAAGRSDPARWAEVAAAWETLTFPWPAAYARWRQAEALLTGDGPRHAADEPLAAAWRAAVGLGAAPRRRALELLAARARIDLTAGTAGTEPAGAPAGPAARLGLTDRELEVLGLLGAGRSNREIAEHLFISPKTASVHVSNILRKLGAENRLQAGAIAQRLGLG